MWLRGRPQIGTFGVKSLVRQRFTMEFANKKEEEMKVEFPDKFKKEKT